jgi:hypothetical protein
MGGVFSSTTAPKPDAYEAQKKLSDQRTAAMTELNNTIARLQKAIASAAANEQKDSLDVLNKLNATAATLQKSAADMPPEDIEKQRGTIDAQLLAQMQIMEPVSAASETVPDAVSAPVPVSAQAVPIVPTKPPEEFSISSIAKKVGIITFNLTYFIVTIVSVILGGIVLSNMYVGDRYSGISRIFYFIYGCAFFPLVLLYPIPVLLGMLKAPQWNALLIPLVDNSKSSPIDPTKVMTGFESLKQFLYNNLASPLIGYDNTEKATWPLLLLSSVLSALFITMSFVMRYVFTPNTFDLVKGKNQSARDYFY